MDSPETLATQDTGRRQAKQKNHNTNQKTKNMSNMDLNKKLV